MNIIKNVLALMMICILSPLALFADEVEIDGLKYELNVENSTATVTGYTKNLSRKDINIPESVKYNENIFTVVAIGDHAFYECSGFTGDLTIQNSVTEIGNYAFFDCSGLTGSLTIPNSVTTIGERAFAYCRGFTGDLKIPSGITTIKYETFYKCSGFNGSLTIPNSVKEIGDHAFDGCSGFTGELTIPNSVTEIGLFAFCDCDGLTGTLTLGSSLTNIGEGAFFCGGFNDVVSLNIMKAMLKNSAIIQKSFTALPQEWV